MKYTTLALLAACLALTACDFEQTGEQKQAEQTAKMVDEATRQIGMPSIVNFQEKRMLKQLYELRDKQVATYTYTQNQMRGCLVFLGQSVGFGLPYSTQYSNPQHLAWLRPDGFSGAGRSEIVAQAEPNGLYMPADAHATWVMLVNPETKEAVPTYVEPDVIVFSYRAKNLECRD